MNYYNEFDKKAAAWLRQLIEDGHIAPGIVDERSITDVDPIELAGFRQHHFFAGIGGWALAARLAGWPDDRELVTGSCPCQPFSVAGKGKGSADDRHLWPDFFRIISALRPACVMGEQVAAAVGKGWFVGVRADMESIGYSGRGLVVPACAVNAPHRRDRLWFAFGSGVVGDLHNPGPQGHAGHEPDRQGWPDQGGPVAQTGGRDYGAANEYDAGVSHGDVPDAERQRVRGEGCAAADGKATGVQGPDGQRQRVWSDAGPVCLSGFGEPGAWDTARWLISHDGKARRVEPSIPLLVDGLPNRVALLRGIGNAIVPQIAAEMMGAWMEEYPA